MSTPQSDFDHFLKEREEASDAFIEGDFTPLEQISTHTSPATIFGPKGDCVEGADNVNVANERGASHFRPGGSNKFEIMHHSADGDLAYWVGIQRSVVRMDGHEQGVPFDLRVTEVFRREDGHWKLIHRHADPLKTAGAA